MGDKRKIDISSLEYMNKEQFVFDAFYDYVFSIDNPAEEEEFRELFVNVDEFFSKFDEDHIIAVLVFNDYIFVMTTDYISGFGHQVHFWRANIL